MFGGLYLPHLRDAVWRRLILAERALNRARSLSCAAREIDLFSEEGRAWYLANEHLTLGIAPERGGMLLEWDDVRTAHNLADTLTRRAEGYHARLSEADAGDSGAGAASIHDRIRAKQPGLEQALHRDRRVRASFLDHVLPATARPEEFRDSAAEEWGDFADRAFDTELRWEQGRITLELSRTAALAAGAAATLRVRKDFTVLEDEPGYEVRY